MKPDPRDYAKFLVSLWIAWAVILFCYAHYVLKLSNIW